MGWILALLLTPIQPAQADVGSCSYSKPLIDERAPWPAESGWVREWRIPVSPERPDVLTAAVLKITLSRSATGGWFAYAQLIFDDPKPFGIPFTFESLQLEWHSPEGRRKVVLDWTNECADAGLSLFPGQHWEETVRLPGMEAAAQVPKFRVHLWGSRN